MSEQPTTVPESFLRHHWLRRVEHWTGALLFIALAITGLAQRYHETGWSGWVISSLGGIDHTRLVHRMCGISFSVMFVVHVAVAFVGVVWWRWQPSMLISRQDFFDAVQNLRYYLRMADHPARCGRYDYRAKFEYWGILFGGILMIATGFVLWFPVWFFQTFSFMPGESIPAAKTVHSNEAMLALSVVVVWHIYNSVFSPEVFPIDRCMFTGRISRERMLHEHPLEYEQLTGRSSTEDAG